MCFEPFLQIRVASRNVFQFQKLTVGGKMFCFGDPSSVTGVTEMVTRNLLILTIIFNRASNFLRLFYNYEEIGMHQVGEVHLSFTCGLFTMHRSYSHSDNLGSQGRGWEKRNDKRAL